MENFKINQSDCNFKLICKQIVDISRTIEILNDKFIKDNFFYYNSLLLSRYRYEGYKLENNVSYTCRVYEILNEMSSQNIIDFMETNCILSLDASALLLLRYMYPNIFPFEHWTLLFSSSENLFLDEEGKHRIPGLYRHREEGFALSLISSFEDGIKFMGTPISFLCISK